MLTDLRANKVHDETGIGRPFVVCEDLVKSVDKKLQTQFHEFRIFVPISINFEQCLSRDCHS
jgi:hypothetical protein